MPALEFKNAIKAQSWNVIYQILFDGRDLSLNQLARMVADIALSECIRKWLPYLLVTF